MFVVLTLNVLLLDLVLIEYHKVATLWVQFWLDWPKRKFTGSHWNLFAKVVSTDEIPWKLEPSFFGEGHCIVESWKVSCLCCNASLVNSFIDLEFGTKSGTSAAAVDFFTSSYK